MPLTGGRIVHSLNQAQGVILETLKEREKDRAEERKEELSAGGLALPSSRSAWPLCLLTAWADSMDIGLGGCQKQLWRAERYKAPWSCPREDMWGQCLQ